MPSARALTTATLLALAACGSEPEGGAPADVAPAAATTQSASEAAVVSDWKPSPAEAELPSTLADEAARIRELLPRMEAQGLLPSVLDELQRLMSQMGDVPWLPVGGWGVSRGELTSFLRMSAPDDEGRVPALDRDDPDAPFASLVQASRELREQGITLVVLPVPKRLQIYPDRLPCLEPRADFAGVDAPWERLLLALAEAGVEVIDLQPDFLAAREDTTGEDDARLYLDYDPHWTPRAVDLAAGRVARRLLALEGCPPASDAGVRVRLERAPFQVYCRLEEGKGQVPLWFRRVEGRDGRPALATDPESPILVLGDSFVGQYREEASDLMRLVHARTGLRFDLVRKDGGAMTVWGDLGRRAELSGKRIVLWVLNGGALGADRVQRLRAEDR